MKNAKVYLIHGYTGSPESDLFPWIIDKLSEVGLNLTAFHMPNPDSPLAAEWDRYLDDNIKELNEDTYFICHSLGCVTLLRYLNRQSARTKIGGAILASGFVEMLPKYPMFRGFIDIDLDMGKLIAMVDKRCVFSSPNDIIVEYKYSQELARLFDAKLVTIEGGGHFIGQEGFSEFPELFEELCAM
ncbi:MAG: alpha/beta hydrolase, partial [Clostridiales bacterium]|nr:alpha/beta hydrolase [Clostridiales bacterium]